MAKGKIRFRQSGGFDRTKKALNFLAGENYLNTLDKYGEEGLNALVVATPKRTGKTAASWSFTITRTDKGIVYSWDNNNVVNDWANIALLIQYGHGTRNGGYVPGIDYINPALRPILDKIEKKSWEEVSRAWDLK